MSNALFLGTYEDRPYLPHLKQMFGGISTYIVTEPIKTLTELEIYCVKRNITSVASTNIEILSRLLSKIAGILSGNSPNLDNYAGSFFSHRGINFVFINPLKQLISVSYGKFLASRYISKLITPQSWSEATTFEWIFANTPSSLSLAYAELCNAYAISIDIETFKHNLSIRCVSFTGIYISSTGTFITSSYVIPLDCEYNLAYIRKINNLPNQKIFQNGKYDNAYFLRYNSPVRNWLWDTAHLFHSYYSELPKDLAFLNAFWIRKAIYWKDLAKTSDLFEYYRYNALDSWATANVWIRQILEMPEWAKHNYVLEFPLVYPCLLSELTGVRRDGSRLDIARRECDSEILSISASLNKILGISYNSNSPIQSKKLLKILTGKDWESSDEKNLEKAAYLHPLNRIIIDKILKVRELKKIKGTYLRTDDDIKRLKDGTPAANANGSKDYKSVWLYSLNPHATDTGRLASGESAFWCGANIQNVVRGKSVKQTVISYPGFRFAEIDLKQAESRDTAYISGSESYIKAVTGARDFHSVNASAFFGIAYNTIYDDATGKTLNKLLRDLAKPVNHGANYNMGPRVMLETMGEKYVWEAARLLNLRGYSALQVCEYLLEQFHRTYPELKRDFNTSVLHEIITTRKLVSKAYHHVGKFIKDLTPKDDWTRYCFGSPDKNKRDFNSYIAHGPQSLNARTLNEAYMKIFYEIAIPNPDTFRLHAQIHDSVLISFKEGYFHHAEKVKELMEIPVTIKSVDGKIRTFTVPADIKAGPDNLGVQYWSDLE